jgi:aminocarboxymuconate-semialdehyde decarboxylase
MAGNSDLKVDVHAHALIPEVETLVSTHEGRRREIKHAIETTGRESVEHNQHLMRTLYLERLTTVRERIAAMDVMGIDVQAVSISPTQYYYWADRDLAQKIVAAANAGVAELCASRPDRFVGMATVSIQHPDLAADQLRHAVSDLALRGVMISTAVDDFEIADPRYEPFWSAAEDLGALVFVHPMGCSLGARLRPYYLSNLIGNPAETTVALAHLVFGGMFDRHPGLRLLAAHGGGYFPFYTGRFDHGWKVRPEARTCEHPPGDYVKRIWFDSLVYTPPSLEHLISRAGAGQVVLGTDFPFDMGVDDPLARLNAVEGLSEAERRAIRGGNAARLLKLATERLS